MHALRFVRDADTYAVLLFLVPVIQSLAVGQFFWLGKRLGIRVRLGIGSAIFDKALRLSYASRMRIGHGAIVSHMQVDSNKLTSNMP